MYKNRIFVLTNFQGIISDVYQLVSMTVCSRLESKKHPVGFLISHVILQSKALIMSITMVIFKNKVLLMIFMIKMNVHMILLVTMILWK